MNVIHWIPTPILTCGTKWVQVNCPSICLLTFHSLKSLVIKSRGRVMRGNQRKFRACYNRCPMVADKIVSHQHLFATDSDPKLHRVFSHESRFEIAMTNCNCDIWITTCAHKREDFSKIAVEHSIAGRRSVAHLCVLLSGWLLFHFYYKMCGL